MEQLYNQLYKDGKYTKSFDDFKVQFGDPEKSEKLYNALNEAGDYTKSFEDFQTQFGFVGKADDSASADPNAESAKKDTGSKSVNGSSGLFADTQEKNTWVEDVFGKNVVTDFFGDLYRAGASGWTAGRSVDEAFDIYKGKDATDEQVYAFLKSQREIESAGQTDEMIEFSKRQQELKNEGYNGVSAFFIGWWENPSIMMQYSTQSLVQMAGALRDSEEVLGTAGASAGVGAGTGAAIGTAFGGIGAAPGAIAGTVSGFFGGLSGAMETGMTTADLIKDKAIEDGLDWGSMSDKERFNYIRKVQSNTEDFNDLKSKAVARGVAIGSIDALTAAVTAGAGAAVERTVAAGTRSALTGAARTATVAGIETVGGMASEVAGQAAAGQEFNLEEILIEGFADKTFTGVSILKNAATSAPSYSINGEKMNGKQFSDALKALDDEAFVSKSAEIKVENSPAVERLVNNRRRDIAADQSVDSRINGVEDRAEAIKLHKERKRLEGNREGNKNKIAQIDAQLKAIEEKYANSEVDATIEQRKQAIAQAVDNKFEAEFNKNYKSIEEGAKELGQDVSVFLDDNTYYKAISDKWGISLEEAAKLAKNSDGVFAGKGSIFINKAQAKRSIDIATGNMGAISVASHEVLHPIFNTLIGGAKTQGQFVNQFKKQMTNAQKAYVNKRLRAYKNQPGAEAIELMNIFSDGIIKGDITYDKTTFEKLGDTIVNLFRSAIGLKTNEISFEDGRGVYNFLKEYNTSVKSGKLSEEALGAIKKAEVQKDAKVADATMLGQEQFSKTQLEGVKKRLSDIPAAEVESRANVNKISAELPAMIGTQINNRFANLDPDTREEFTYDVLEKILRPNKEGVNKDLKWDGRGDLYGFLNGRISARIKDAIREDYNRPAAERMYVGRIDPNQLEDLTKEQATDTTTEETTTKTTKSTEESVERGQAKFDELDIVDEALIKDIAQEIEREIRVRVQKGTLSEMVGVKKGRETYMVTWLEDYVNKQLFKKLSKKLGAISGVYPNTVIPAAYRKFLEDPKTFDIITKALPIRSIKKSYGKLFEIERIGREVTAEGNPVFRIKKINQDKFIAYFTEGNKSTVLERQKQLFREILEPLVKQVIADYATAENISSLKEIQELAPATSIDVTNKISLDAALNNLESQIDRYKGEKAGFDIIQFSLTKNDRSAISEKLGLSSDSNISMAQLASMLISQTLRPTIRERKAIIQDIKDKLGPELYEKLESTIIGDYLDALQAIQEKEAYERGVAAEQLVWDTFNKIKGITMVSKRPDGKSGSSEADIVVRWKKNNITFEVKHRKSDRLTSLNINNYTDSKKYSTSRNAGDASTDIIFKAIKDSEALNNFINKVKALMKKKYPNENYLDKQGRIELTPEQIKELGLEESLYKETKTEIFGLNEQLIETIYNEKDSNYLTFTDIGTFYVGNNPLNFSIPKFEANLYTRAWLKKNEIKKNGKHTFILRMFSEMKTDSAKKLSDKNTVSLTEVNSAKTFLNKTIQLSLTSTADIKFNESQFIKGQKIAFFPINNIEYVARLLSFRVIDQEFNNTEPWIEKLKELTGNKNVQTDRYQHFAFDRNDTGDDIVSREDAQWNGKRYVFPKSDTKQALAVFGSLSNYFLNEIKKGNIDGLVFTGVEPSRQRLYAALVERFARQLGWNSDIIVREDSRGGNTYFVAKPENKADVKSKVSQTNIQFSKDLNKEFNDIIEDTTGLKSEDIIGRAKAKVLGEGKGKFKFFIPPSADDFAGLLYKLLGKGKKGEAQQAWFKKALFDPFAKGIREFETYKEGVTLLIRQLKKEIKNIPAGLKKTNATGFTNEVAVRVYLWVKNGHEISTDDLTPSDVKELVKIVKNDPALMDFAEQVDAVLSGYPEPQNDWLAGTITTDAINMINTEKRAAFLEEWQQNADVIFSKENLNKLRAAFGDNYVEALEDMLYRMKTGRNRPYGANKLTNRFMNWVNDSVGTIMFFNTRSALLQTLSTVNFINWGDNNPIAAAKAFANQKQFWADFSMLFNSDFLKQRRSGLKNDVNADDIAAAAETSQNKAKAVLSSILKMGFLPTQIADSFAIALGGASFVRNRINTYISEGMGKEAAQEQAFLDFQEIAEETQQSSRPDRISQQQASPLGRIILAFANTPMQYMRLTKKAFLDLKNGRGDAKTNITKMAYYFAVQNVIFSALQSALFATMFEDDDEEAIKDKELRVANSMLDSILRGVGIYGAIASTLKNIALEVKAQTDKPRPDFTVAAQRALSISPPIDSKMRKLMSAARAFSYKTTREKMTGYGLDNPAYYAVGQMVSATTNVPLDRAIRKADNIRVALDNDTKYWQSVALLLGYSQWDVGMVETSKEKKKKSKFGKTTKWKKVERGSWKK